MSERDRRPSVGFLLSVHEAATLEDARALVHNEIRGLLQCDPDHVVEIDDQPVPNPDLVTGLVRPAGDTIDMSRFFSITIDPPETSPHPLLSLNELIGVSLPFTPSPAQIRVMVSDWLMPGQV